MNILVLGWYYSTNLGDGVLCECVARRLQLREPGSRVEIRDIAGRKAFPRGIPTDRKLRRRNLRRASVRQAAAVLGWDRVEAHVRWRMKQTGFDPEDICRGDWDRAVFAGGQLFMDDIGLYVSRLTACLAEWRIPVFFNAVGLGPFRSRKIRGALLRELERADVRYLSCRDGADWLAARTEGIAVSQVSDPALWAGWVYGVRAESGEGPVGLGIQEPKNVGVSAALRFWTGLIGALESRGIPWKMFTNGDYFDSFFAQRILQALPEGKRADRLCPVPQSPEALVRLIASFQRLVGFRLHSHIIAASLGIPSVGVEWDPKVRAFFEKAELPAQCVTVHSSAKKVLSLLMGARAVDRELLQGQRARAEESLLAALKAVPGRPEEREQS